MFQHHKNFDKIFRYSNFLWPFAPYLTWGVVNCGFVNFIWRKLLIYRRSWLRCVVFSCVSVLDILPAHLSGKFCQLSGHSTIFPSIRPSVRLFVRSLARSFVRLFVRSVGLSFSYLSVIDLATNEEERRRPNPYRPCRPPPPLPLRWILQRNDEERRKETEFNGWKQHIWAIIIYLWKTKTKDYKYLDISLILLYFFSDKLSCF